MSRPFVFLAVIVCLWVNGTWANTHSLVRQSTVSDCGPAALATLLNYYLDVPANEDELARLSGVNSTGTTLIGLEAAAKAKGCGADSFRMNLSTLRRQLASYPAPLLVRLLNPEPHFVLVLAIENNTVFVADPATGNSLLPEKRFLARWLIPRTDEGYVFIAARSGGRTNVARRDEIIGELRRQIQALQTQRLAPAMRR